MELRIDEWKAPHVHADGAQQVCFDACRRTCARMPARLGRRRLFTGAPPGLMKSSLNHVRVCARICAEAWQPDESSRTFVTQYRSNFGLLGCTLACTPDTVGVKLPDTACHSCGEERSSNSFSFRVFRVCCYIFTFFSFSLKI